MPLTLLKGLYVRGSCRPNRTAKYWPPHSIGYNRVSFPFSWAAQSGFFWAAQSGFSWAAQSGFSQLHLISNSSNLQTDKSAAWGLSLLGAGFLYRILSPTDWISCALSYIIVQRPPSSCGHYKLLSFNPSTVKVILCYSSTGCICYLHRFISYFDSPAGS